MYIKIIRYSNHEVNFEMMGKHNSDIAFRIQTILAQGRIILTALLFERSNFWFFLKIHKRDMKLKNIERCVESIYEFCGIDTFNNVYTGRWISFRWWEIFAFVRIQRTYTYAARYYEIYSGMHLSPATNSKYFRNIPLLLFPDNWVWSA